MKFSRLSKVIGLSLMLLSMQVSAASQSKDTIFQVATMNALAQGVFDGDYTYGQLAKHGNFGIGTFMDLDGEMVAVDGLFYRIEANGNVSRVRNNEVVPFAQIVRFDPAFRMRMKDVKTYRILASLLHKKFNNSNIPYAIRIDGKFKRLKLRSLRKQKSPYPTLLEASKNQAVFNMKNIEGTIVGFWFPKYWSGIVVPGFHLHFIDKNKIAGGHVLELALEQGVTSLQALHQVDVYLPSTGTFSRADLSADRMHHAIKQAEGGVQ